MAYQNGQTKTLRKSILLRSIVGVVLFTIAYAVLVIVFDTVFRPIVSELIYAAFFNGSWSLYDLISSIYIPVILLVYMGGVFMIIYSGTGRVLKNFDILLSSVQSILQKSDEPIVLPSELSQTALALTQIRDSNRHNEEAAKAAEARKNELVVYLAHDIKTPLTSIVGYLSLLSESPDMPVETRARYAGIALDKAYHLEELIDEFFEITRYNLQTIPIERAHFDAVLFCQQVIDDLYPQAQARSLTMCLHAPETLSVFADANRLSRVLNNVLKNALSYADEATEIAVYAEICTVRNNELWYKMSVSNRGREITPEHLERSFEKFYRGDEARSSVSGGTGLGLAIAREITRAHGGDITASSTQGLTCYTIWIPQPQV